VIQKDIYTMEFKVNRDNLNSNNFDFSLVIGLGKSGINALRLLRKLNLNCTACDESEESKFKGKIPEELLSDEAINWYFSKLPYEIISPVNKILAVISPGVPFNHPFLQFLQKNNVLLITELELGLLFIDATKIIVTGSNGKSTTTALINHLLNCNGISSTVAGNIGTPPSELVADGYTKFDYIVVEASSYQLEASTVLSADIAVFLNFADNHSARHGSASSYFKAKCRLFNDFLSGTAILNCKDKFIVELGNNLNSPVIWFDQDLILETEILIPYSQTLAELPAPVKSNLSVTLKVMEKCGISLENTIVNLSSFLSLPHRQEIIKQNQVTWINDAKSTCPEATYIALTTIFKNNYSPSITLHLLIGGSENKGNWNNVWKLIRNFNLDVNIVCIGLIGKNLVVSAENSELFASYTTNLKDAIKLVVNTLKPDDIVLYSPGAPSFDEFNNFEERGNTFKQMINVAI
jgi:UDP-N-acetylmuramoylalanine--D-glutamate ligase